MSEDIQDVYCLPRVPACFDALSNQSTRDNRADGLASANFKKSLDQLNKLDEKAFQQFLQRKMKKWLQDFLQMVPAEDAEGVEVVDMAAFAGGGGWDWLTRAVSGCNEASSAIFGRLENLIKGTARAGNRSFLDDCLR